MESYPELDAALRENGDFVDSDAFTEEEGRCAPSSGGTATHCGWNLRCPIPLLIVCALPKNFLPLGLDCIQKTAVSSAYSCPP